MMIKELWFNSDDEDFIQVNVVSLIKFTAFVEGRAVGEIMGAVVYDPTDGRLMDLNLNDCYIKTMIDEKDKNSEPVTFDKPRPGGAEGKDREHNNPGDSSE